MPIKISLLTSQRETELNPQPCGEDHVWEAFKPTHIQLMWQHHVNLLLLPFKLMQELPTQQKAFSVMRVNGNSPRRYTTYLCRAAISVYLSPHTHPLWRRVTPPCCFIPLFLLTPSPHSPPDLTLLDTRSFSIWNQPNLGTSKSFQCYQWQQNGPVVHFNPAHLHLLGWKWAICPKFQSLICIFLSLH